MGPVNRITKIARNAKSHALYNYLPGAVDWAVKVMTRSAGKRIIEANASRLLIDNSVLGNAVTHETGWIDTGRKMWGGEIPIDTGFSARIPVHSELDHSDAARSVRMLPAIASLARDGVVTLLTSPELDDEQMTHPIGRFRGYGSYDYSLFSNVSIESLPDPTYSMRIGPAYLGIPSLTDQRYARLAKKPDPLFRDLLKVLGPNKSGCLAYCDS